MGCTDSEGSSAVAKDHAAQPRNHGPLTDFNGHARITGPCGDTMEYWLMIRNGKVENVSFTTDGCGSSLACGSMATSLVKGKRFEDAAALKQKDILEALGGLSADFEHCALLAANTLKAACADYQSHNWEPQHEPQDKSTCESCADTECSTSERGKNESDEEFNDRRKLQARLCRIRHKIVVLSGKGGVGKSTVAVNLAITLMLSGKRVGLLDIDIHGPSIPTMLGLERETVQGSEEGLLPIELGEMKVMSIGFLLQNQDSALIWRGPMKMGVIKQFLKDVEWGDLDYLIIDSPPGTGDEPLSICQLIGTLDGAVIVTTPQKVAAVDVRKSISFCRQLNVPVLGVVENMSGFSCPKCGEITQILPAGSGKRIAEDMNVPFLGAIPMDPKIAEACDNGQAFIHHYTLTPTAAMMRDILQRIILAEPSDSEKSSSATLETKEDKNMRIAIPLADGKLAMHFGHCASFALLDVNLDEKKITSRQDVDAPPHEPGLLPKWLAERGANLIIAGGMGQRAQGLFTENGIEVLVGAPAETPEKLATDYLAGALQSGANVCDH